MKETAIKAAKAAGKIIAARFKGDNKISFKDNVGNNIVTEVDILSEKKIVSKIKEKFPDHNILSEETVFSRTSSPYTWIIDPIDGTVNFSRGIPLFIVGISLKKEDSIVLTVCYDPIHKELFHAEKGKGAYLNNTRISVSNKPLINTILGVEGMHRAHLKKIVEAIREKSGGNVHYRCAILEICYVACGRLEGIITKGLFPWDYAPSLIITEAGGKVTALDGSPFSTEKDNLLASNGKIHDELLKIVGKHAK